MRRKTTSSEYFLNFHGKHNPVNFGFKARVSGTVTEAALRSAADAVKRKHVLIAVRLEADERRKLFTTTEGVSPFDITVYPASERPWTELLRSEIVKPIDLERGPGVRFALRSAGSSTELFASFHHAIADGVGAVSCFDDLFAVLAGSTVEPYETDRLIHEWFKPEVEAALSQRKPPDFGPLPVVDPAELRRRIDAPYVAPEFSLSAWELSADETARLVAAAKASGVTVHALLGAAWLSASADVLGPETGRTRTIQCPVDLRPYVKEEARGVVGVYNSIVFAPVDCSVGRSFADIARDIKSGLEAQRADYKDVEEYWFYRDSMHEFDDADSFMAIWTPGPLNYDFSLSNLGRIALKDAYGPFAVEEFWGPTFSAVNGERVIGVNTHAGRLRMTYIFDPAVCDAGASMRILEGAKRNVRALIS